ncbi:MAG: RidA family protein [Caulobacterales bacterium]
MIRIVLFAALAALAGPTEALAKPGAAPPPAIKRTVDPAAKIPIAASVTVPAGMDLVFVSGMLPAVVNEAAPAGSIEAYGPDTKTHAVSVLARVKAALAAEGLTFADVTTARVFLIGDPKLNGRMDFAGFNEAFKTEFGTEAQPNRPARTVIQVVALPAPGALVEMDVIAAKSK